MKIRTTIPPSKILSLQPSKKYLKKLIAFGLKILEKYFGSKLLLEIPDELQNLNPEIFRPMGTAAKLKDFGILTGIKKPAKFPDEPFLHRYVSEPYNAGCAGTDFFSEEKALWETLGETTERYLWRNSNHFYQNELIFAPYRKLKAKALDIFSLAGFSEEQKGRLGALSFDKNTVLGWTRAVSLTSGQKIFCPVQLLSARYFREKVKTPENKKKKEPMLRWVVTTGLATGLSLEEAVAKGILEIMERDAFMINYLNQLSPPAVDLQNLAEQENDIAEALKRFKRYNLEVHLFRLPTDFPVEIILALTVDRTGLGPALAVGASADFEAKTAILDALSESLSVRMAIKNSFQREIDRRKIGRVERMIYWSKLENLPKMDFIFKGKKINLELERDKSFYVGENNPFERKKYYQDKLAFLTKTLKKKNYEAFYAELTDREVKQLGFRCAYVVIPELQPLHLNENIPYFGGKRLKEVPLKLGYEPAEELNQEPHPFP